MAPKAPEIPKQSSDLCALETICTNHYSNQTERRGNSGYDDEASLVPRHVAVSSRPWKFKYGMSSYKSASDGKIIYCLSLKGTLSAQDS